ncbi:MAG: hypothetical protein IKB80_04680 [Oscillospiraceae bacterium]|nr:hypothetical protein [Oscillospiraceae bacterium]
MTYLEIDSAIIDVVHKVCNECKTRLDTIPKENTTERKAVQLEYGMYTFCGNAGALFNMERDRAKVVHGRQYYCLNEVLHKYPVINSAYRALNSEDKLRFIAALQAELFIREQWLDKKEAELAAATAAGDAKSVFELTIQLGAVKNMFAAWEQWRIENNIFPHMFEGDCA